MKKAYEVVIGRAEGKRPIRKTCKWEDNTKMKCESVHSIRSVEDVARCCALVNTIMQLRGSIRDWKSLCNREASLKNCDILLSRLVGSLVSYLVVSTGWAL
jgi:hypothetical protein